MIDGIRTWLSQVKKRVRADIDEGVIKGNEKVLEMQRWYYQKKKT
jgi:hypothetical protein